MDKTNGQPAKGPIDYHMNNAPVTDTSGMSPTNIYFTLQEHVGALANALKIFERHGVNLRYIESRPAAKEKGSSFYDFFVTCDNSKGGLTEAIDDVRAISNSLTILQRSEHKSDIPADITVPWFPRKVRELDVFASHILSYGHELESDHPGFTDEVYRVRRKEFADLAFNYKHGEKLPRVTYTPDEIATWGAVYKELTALYPTHACKQFNYAFPLLEQNCGFSPDNIPQLEDISTFLKDCTGFSLRPVAGLLTSRDFLAGLAFRVFHSTQYVRHHSKPLYTPEPDVCHELMGHVPLFADPEFAAFSQEIGLASLGASDADIERLATCYWFTVEFGLCKEEGEIKAFGAGLLSGFGELKYCLSDKPQKFPFDPAVTALRKYPITEYQPVYYVAENFEDAKTKMRAFASSMSRSFAVRYNAYTQSIEVIDSAAKMTNVLQEVKSLQNLVEDAVKKICI